MTREYKVVPGIQLRDLRRSPFPGFQLAPTQSTLHPLGTRVRILIHLSLHLYSSAYHPLRRSALRHSFGGEVG